MLCLDHFYGPVSWFQIAHQPNLSSLSTAFVKSTADSLSVANVPQMVNESYAQFIALQPPISLVCISVSMSEHRIV